jgi:exodeoxyribonuclease V alpha subunit
MTIGDVEVAVGATGVLREFNEAGVLDIADVHVAQRLTALGAEPDESVALAVALAVRVPSAGSTRISAVTGDPFGHARAGRG